MTVACQLALTPTAFAQGVGAGSEEIPAVRTGAEPGSHIKDSGEISFMRRGIVPLRLQGDVTFGLDTARPGALNPDPDSHVVGRLGLGGGFAVRLAATRNGSTSKYRPGVGLGYQFIGRDGSPLSVAVAVDYRPEGFNEIKGEVEAGLHATYKRGRLEMTGNAVTGIEPGFDSGDAEAAMSGAYRVTPDLLLGVQGRYRAAIPYRMHEEVLGVMAALRVWRAQLTAVLGGESLTIRSTKLGVLGSVGLTFGF